MKLRLVVWNTQSINLYFLGVAWNDFLEKLFSGGHSYLKEACFAYPLVFEVVRVDVLQGHSHQVRGDVGVNARQLFSRLQVGPGPRDLHVAKVLPHTNLKK